MVASLRDAITIWGSFCYRALHP